MRTAVITMRVDEKTKERIDKIAKATERPVSYLLHQALERVLEVEEWQVGQLRKTIEKADKPGAKFIPHEDVEVWLKTWGKKNERKPPKCA